MAREIASHGARNAPRDDPRADAATTHGSAAADGWYWSQSGVARGPLDLAELRRLATTGAIRPDTWIYAPASLAWIRAADVAALENVRRLEPHADELAGDADARREDGRSNGNPGGEVGHARHESHAVGRAETGDDAHDSATRRERDASVAPRLHPFAPPTEPPRPLGASESRSGAWSEASSASTSASTSAFISAAPSSTPASGIDPKTATILCRASVLLAPFVLIVFALAVPIVVWAIGARDAKVVAEAKRTLDCLLTIAIASLAAAAIGVAGILCIVGVFVPVLFYAVVLVYCLVVGVRGLVAASEERPFDYPATLRLLR